MRRWNGWGEESTVVELPDSARGFLAELVGQGARLPDASLEAALAKVPASRLEADPRYSIDPRERLLHARGQSLPDWLAMREGDFGVYPDAVAIRKPPSRSASCWPWPTPRPATDSLWRRYFRGRPYQSASLAAAGTDGLAGRMNRLLDLDRESLVATFGPGAAGPQVESQLRALGYARAFPAVLGVVDPRWLGRQPLQWPAVAALWADRTTFAGGTLETFAGPLEIATFPASAAGPDLRELVLGSEDASGSFPR